MPIEDITQYGEIDSKRHKSGETTAVATGLGVLMALGGLFFLGTGVAHAVFSLNPYWERIQLGEIPAEGATANFAAFTLLVLARALFGALLLLVAFEYWDQRSVARRLTWTFVVPVLLLFFQATGEFPEAFREDALALGVVFRNHQAAACVVALGSLAIASLASLLVGWVFRETEEQTTWVMAAIYAVAVAAILGLAAGQLTVVERDTALFGDLPPFSQAGSGIQLLVLESISPQYLTCMDSVQTLERACAARLAAGGALKYDNFGSRPRTERLMEVLKDARCLAVKPVCPEEGYYVVRPDGTWTCSRHGAYDADRVARGKRLLQSTGLGATVEGGQ